MRILYLCGGVDTPSRMLIEQLATRRDVDVTVMCECRASLEAARPFCECRSFKSRGKIDVTAIRRLRRELLANDYDVVHTLSSRLLTNALLAARGIPQPPAVLGFVGFISRFSHWNPVHRLTYLHPQVAGICCNCEAAAEPLAAAGVPRHKLFTIYAGHPYCDRPAPPNLAVRRELEIPENALVVGFAGNMRPVYSRLQSSWPTCPICIGCCWGVWRTLVSSAWPAILT
jgi:hypothetical protein